MPADISQMTEAELKRFAACWLNSDLTVRFSSCLLLHPPPFFFPLPRLASPRVCVSHIANLKLFFLFHINQQTNWEGAHASFDPDGKSKFASFRTITSKASKKAANAGGGVGGGAAGGDETVEKPKKGPKRKKAVVVAAKDVEEDENEDEDEEAEEPKVKKGGRGPGKRGGKKPYVAIAPAPARAASASIAPAPARAASASTASAAASAAFAAAFAADVAAAKMEEEAMEEGELELSFEGPTIR